MITALEILKDFTFKEQSKKCPKLKIMLIMLSLKKKLAEEEGIQ